MKSLPITFPNAAHSEGLKREATTRWWLPYLTLPLGADVAAEV